MARIKSKKYDGVYTNKLRNGDISYYITFKDIHNKLKWVKIGTNKKNTDEITEKYCNTKRNEYINKMNLGEDPQAKKKKKAYHQSANKSFTLTRGSFPSKISAISRAIGVYMFFF